MNLKTIIIILSLFCFSAISQNIKQDSCQLFFSEIGIKDFNLSSTFRSFVNDSKKRKFSKKIYRIDIKEKYKNIHKYESDTIEYLDAILEYENSKKKS